MALSRDAAYRCDERGYNTLPLADNTIVYRHAALGLSAGRVRPIQTGDRFAGFVARRNQDSRGLAAGAPPVQVPIISAGTIELPISGVAATDVGATVYATDDDTFGLTGAVAIGAISGIAAPGVARVAFSALGASPVSGDGGGAIFGPYADVIALEAAKPAASNPGAQALVGSSAPYQVFAVVAGAWAATGVSGGTVTAASITDSSASGRSVLTGTPDQARTALELGSAATQASSAFATAAQGAKADSAVQPGGLATVATSGAYSDLSGRPTLGTAAATDSSAYATAAQGAKADTAVQPGALASVATSGAYADLSGRPDIGAAADARIAAASINALADVDTTGAASGQVLKFNGSSWVPGADETAAGGGSATNLGATASPTGVTVTSDTGNDAVLPLADGTNAGLMAPAQHTKLAGIAAGATANATDAQLRDRATHTGTQTASTISDFAAAVSAHPRTIKGPHTYAEMLALSTAGFTAGATHVYCNSPAERIGIYVWDGTNYSKENSSIISAERSFGIRPGVGVDNTAAFEALCTWMSNIADDGFYVIDFGPGEFYTDHITTLKPVSGSVSATILFSGVPGHTIFTARTSSRPVFFTIHAAYQAQSAFRGFRVQGIGATNPYQDGVAVVSDFRSLDDTAGITNGLFSHVTVRGFHGKAVWMRGGLFEAGRWAWLWPNQFIEFQQCFFESEFDSSFEATGQFGQIGFQGGTLDGNNRTNVPGSGAYIGIDHRNLSHGISAVSGNKFQLSNIYEAPTGTPVRVIGTTLAAPLSTGTTYWAFPVDLNDSASEGRYISLASTRALAGTKTPITITSAGTPSNYRLVWIWATGAPASNEFTTEFNHRLCTGDKIHLEGTNVPTGTVARTTYYVIRTGHRTFKLAASETNAGNGTAMAVSGGTAADYGFVLNDYGKGPSEMIGAYSVDMRTTTQGRNEGIVVNGSWDVRLNLHVENMITPVRVINSVVSINEGAYQNAAYGIAGEGVLWSVSGANSRVTLYGNISVLGTTERLIANLGNSGGGQVWADGACITGPSGWNPPATQTAGMVRQVGTAGGVLDTGHNSDVFVNASATTINTITSGLTYGRELRLMAFGGSITLGNGGNIKMPSSSVTIPDGGTAVLRRWDTVATWLLVSVNLVPGIGGALGSTDNALLRADGTAGLTAQGSGATLSDTGVLSGVTYAEAREQLGAVTTSGATTISASDGAVQRVVLGGAHQISLPADPGSVSLSLTLILLCQGFTPTWGTSPTITWINADGSGTAPTLNTTSGKQNVITFVWDDNGGGTGTWLGFFGGKAA